ncbi:MAG: MinD/ParA family protein [Candidatus Hydrogenedentota bacterium]
MAAPTSPSHSRRSPQSWGSSDQAAALRLVTAGQSRPGRRPERIIAVASGKGGVGKSNIALNLAIELSGRGRSTCLFDADLGMANAHILAGVNPRYTLGHVLTRVRTIDEIMTPGPRGVQLISGSNGLSEMANLTTEQRQRLLTALAGIQKELDYLVVDTGAGISANVLSFLERSDEAIIVLTPEPPSMADAYGMIKALTERNYSGRLSLAVNRAASVGEARLIAEKMQALARQYLRRDVEWIGFLLEDPAVQRAVRKRAPFSAVDRASKAARSIARMAARIEKEAELADRDEGVPDASAFQCDDAKTGVRRLRSWFERLFS